MTRMDGFSGVISPALTPFTADLAPDLARFVTHCKWLLDQGCAGLAVFGTTSEANSLSGSERMALLEGLIASDVDPAVLMPGTGACSIIEAASLTKHAVELGCGGVLLLPPYYYKNVDDDGIFDFIDQTIQRVADDRLKIYLYHIPPQTIFGYSLDLIGRLIDAFPDTIAGIKDSSGDWDNMAEILKNFPTLGMFPGSEVYMLQALRHGAAGCITASANINPAQLRELYDNWETPEADAMQAAVTALRHIVQGYPMIPALKEINAHFKGDDGLRGIRPPFTAMSAGQVESLLAELAGIDYAIERPMAMAGE